MSSHAPQTWILLVFLCFGQSIANAESPAGKYAPLPAWRPKSICVTAPYCGKECPTPPCWCYARRCDDYCRKELPCRPTPCIPFRCDDYQCKPAPCWFPPSPCCP